MLSAGMAASRTRRCFARFPSWMQLPSMPFGSGNIPLLLNGRPERFIRDRDTELQRQEDVEKKSGMVNV